MKVIRKRIMAKKEFTTFNNFYPYYLSEHQHPICRGLHFIGTSIVISLVLYSIIFQSFVWLLSPIIGYGFAWIGHFFFEKNKPATFTYPLYSFMGDFVMFWDILRGKERII